MRSGGRPLNSHLGRHREALIYPVPKTLVKLPIVSYAPILRADWNKIFAAKIVRILDITDSIDDKTSHQLPFFAASMDTLMVGLAG